MTLCDRTHFRIFFLALVTVMLQMRALDVRTDTFDQDLLLFSFDFDWKQLNKAQSKISDLKEQ